MAWSSAWPPTTELFATLDYDKLIELYKAARERQLAAGALNFPHQIWTPDSGTIGSITATTLTDSTKSWSTAPKRWVSWSTGSAWDPVDYDVMIGDPVRDDPWEIIRVPVTNNTATTLTFSNISSWVNSNRIYSVSSLVGKPYFLVRRTGTYYPIWSERWPARPNNHRLAMGNVTSATTRSITVSGAGWTVNQFAGKAVFTIDTNGIVQRVSITGNTEDTLNFTVQSWTAGAGQPFEIQASTSAMCWPGVNGDKLWAWYRGHMTGESGGAGSVQTMFPDNSIGGMNAPSSTFQYSDWNGVTCTATSGSIFDVDFIIDFQNECGDRDKHFSVNMYKSLRGLQVWADGICTSFIEARRWNGTGYTPIDWDYAPFIEAMWPAMLHRSAGVNYHGSFSGTSDGFGDLTISVTGLPTPAPTYHYALQITGTEYTHQAGTSSSSSLSFSGLDASTGYTLVVSLGCTRKIPMMARLLFDKTHFIPEADGMGNLVDPPTSSYPGEWFTRDKSTKLLEYTDSMDTFESQNITDGGKVRYVGDRSHDQGVAGNFGGYAPDALNDYLAYGAVKQHPETEQTFLDSQLTGTATGGASTYLVTASQNWWTNNWYSGGVMITHTGTATGGSSTTLIDTTKAGNGFWAGIDGRWVGHCIEIDLGGGNFEQRICTAYNSATQTLTVSPAWSTSASGKAYRIREPKYELNRYKGRKLTITDAAGDTHETTITASTDTYLFFTDIGTAVGEGWRFEIQEIAVGSVCTRAGSVWTPVARPFEDEPDNITRYGRLCLGDYLGNHVYDDLYRLMNALRWTFDTYTWRAYQDGVTPEDNQLVGSSAGAGFVTYPTPPPWPDHAAAIAYAVQYAKDIADAVGPIAGGGTPRQGNVTTDHKSDLAPGVNNVTASFSSIAGYGVVTVPPSGYTGMTCTTEFYTYGAIDPTDPDEGDYYSDAPTNHDKVHFEFKDNGYDISYHLWRYFDSVTDNTDDERVTSKFNSVEHGEFDEITEADDAVPPTSYSTSSNNTAGFYVLDSKVINKWDVGGGFTYID